MRTLTRALRTAILTCAAALAQTTFAAPPHNWTYHVNGRYGYVESQYTNVCDGVPWTSCSHPILWVMYDGTASLGVLKAKVPNLYQLIQPALDPSPQAGMAEYVTIFNLVPSPTQYIGDDAGVKDEEWVILEQPTSPWKWGMLPHQAHVLKAFADHTQIVRDDPLQDHSVLMRVYDDVRTLSLTLSQPTASDVAQLTTARQWGKDHPDPAHWWAYDVNGVYGYVKDSVDPTCTPDWHRCKKPIQWLLYNGRRDNGENVFTAFETPTELDTSQQNASPVTVAMRPGSNHATVSYLVTDGSEASQDISMAFHSDLWFVSQDIAHSQLQPSSLTVAEMNTLADQRKKFNAGRQAFMRRALQDYLNRQEIIVHTEP